ncbi:hypothetical protein ACLOJK_025442 [Asimina triloba]
MPCFRLTTDVAGFRLQFKIALCQLSVTVDKEKNIAHAQKAIEEAADKGAVLVVLPEIWNSPYSNDSFPVYAEDIDAGGNASPSLSMLSEVASRRQITIVGGSIPERSGDRLYNTCCVLGTDGKLKAKHRKIHLFDIDIPGKITFKESKTLTAGETPTIVDTDRDFMLEWVPSSDKEDLCRVLYELDVVGNGNCQVDVSIHAACSKDNAEITEINGSCGRKFLGHSIQGHAVREIVEFAAREGKAVGMRGEEMTFWAEIELKPTVTNIQVYWWESAPASAFDADRVMGE